MDAGAETMAYEADTPKRRALEAPPFRKPGGVAKAPVPPVQPDPIKGAIRRALAVRRDVDRFERAWPGPGGAEEPLPAFSWGQLERQLFSLAGPTGALIAPDLIRSVRKSVGHKPSEMVLREILCLASTLMDEENIVAADRGGGDLR
jgi:hypothetical protein